MEHQRTIEPKNQNQYPYISGNIHTNQSEAQIVLRKLEALPSKYT